MPARERASIDPDWLAKLIILVLCITAPAFLRDDAAYFSYLNNVVRPPALYYVNGFVYLIPELAAYALSVFPFAIQGVLYRLPPLIMAIIIYREYRRLFEKDADRATASVVALAAILMTRVIEPDLFGDLGFLHYACYVWAVIRVARMEVDGAALSRLDFAALLVSSISFPLGVLFAPVLLLQANRAATPRARRQRQVLAVSIVAVHLAFALRAGGLPFKFESPYQIVAAFLTNFRERKLHNLVVVISTMVLTILAARSRGQSRTLWFFGIASAIAYCFSDRFRQNNGGFEPQHVLPILTCALIAVGVAILRTRDAHARGTRIGAAIGFAVAMALVAFYSTLRGPLELSLMKYRFLSVAEDFRRHCREGDLPMVFEDDGRSPVVLCKPQALPVGFHPVRVPPTVGNFDPASDDPPGIGVEKPLF